MRLIRRPLTAALCCVLATLAQAQSVDPLRDAAQKAIATNPEVAARFNAFRASADAVDAARGAWLPKVDLQADVGRTDDRITSRSPESSSLTRTGVAIQLRQMLWDGLATRSDVGRLGHERVARYFDFIDASEQTALEAARAYYDVLRFRRLVSLAEDNYVQHRYVFNQLQSRVRPASAAASTSSRPVRDWRWPNPTWPPRWPTCTTSPRATSASSAKRRRPRCR